jgi:NADPH-dependent ferric siderophore reductase
VTVDGPSSSGIRTRRAPPPLRRARVTATSARTPRLQRVTLAGPELIGLPPADPAASVRLLLPHHGALVLPEWTGNEFRHADGSRPHLRTLTPLRIDDERGEVDVEIVLHGDGPMAAWAASAAVGDEVAVSGTGRGYPIPAEASDLLVAGDESARPAVSTILAALPAAARVQVILEVAHPDAELDLRAPAGASVTWVESLVGAPPGDALARGVEAATIGPSTRVWVAGEAASVQRIRRHLFEDRGLPRSQCTVRGYWKHGRAGDDGD